jgi:hypothetical protein
MLRVTYKIRIVKQALTVREASVGRLNKVRLAHSK